MVDGPNKTEENNPRTTPSIPQMEPMPYSPEPPSISTPSKKRHARQLHTRSLRRADRVSLSKAQVPPGAEAPKTSIPTKASASVSAAGDTRLGVLQREFGFRGFMRSGKTWSQQDCGLDRVDRVLRPSSKQIRPSRKCTQPDAGRGHKCIQIELMITRWNPPQIRTAWNPKATGWSSEHGRKHHHR